MSSPTSAQGTEYRPRLSASSDAFPARNTRYAPRALAAVNSAGRITHRSAGIRNALGIVAGVICGRSNRGLTSDAAGNVRGRYDVEGKEAEGVRSIFERMNSMPHLSSMIGRRPCLYRGLNLIMIAMEVVRIS